MTVDSDAKCNPSTAGIGSSSESRVSHSRSQPLALLPGDEDGSTRRNIEPRQGTLGVALRGGTREAFSVREDTVRLWRSEFARGGVEALKATVAPGPPPVKTEAALRVVAPLLEAPVADRPNWTIPRLMAEIEAREGVKIGKSQLSKALRKKTSVGGAPGTR